MYTDLSWQILIMSTINAYQQVTQIYNSMLMIFRKSYLS